MRTAFRLAVITLLVAAAPPRGSWAQAPADTSADARLRQLYTEEWNWRQQEFGRGSDRFARVDAASQQARLAYWTKTLAALDAIPFDQLSAEEKINAQIFRTSLRELTIDIQYQTYEAPFNSDTFFWTSFTPRQGFATASAYRSYLARLRGVPRYFDEQITNMRAGLARGYSVPRVSVIGRDRTLEPYVKADASNPLYTPFAQMPDSMPAAEQAALRAEASAVIKDVIAPAYANLLSMIRNEYLEKARRTLGASEMPDGSRFYQAQIEKHTTLTLTPREIHDIGLKELARIDAEMRATKDRAGFKGTMAEFFTFLRTDPQFYAKTPRELLSYAAYVSKKADDKLAETIGFLPRRRHGIRPVPDAIAPIYTGGRGGLDACQMNTALHAAGPDAARVHARPQLPGGAGARRTRAAGVSQGHVVLGIRRGLGPLRRVAGHGDGDLRDAVRGHGAARLRNVARVPPRHRHRHSPVRLDARPGARLPARSRAALGARDHHRDRSLHRVAGTGARLQAG
jgi:uncharacterized protein (DUF885 family)